MTKNNPYSNFCILPFIHLATTTEGTCRLCCKVSKHDVILKNDGTPFNVNKDSINEIWNSDHYNSIRNKILQNEKLPECKTCFKEEEIYYSEWSEHKKDELPSKRRKENQKWLHREKTKLNDTWDNIIHKPSIRYFDIRLSNLCNLKCRMCWPHFSSQISKEQTQFAKEGLPTWYNKYEVEEWDTQRLWNGIDQNLINIEEISFVGGEPTLHDEIYELLEKLVETGQSKNIRLKFTTNLTNIQNRMLDYMTNFKNVIINGSLDGVEEANNYIRFPSDWNTVESNIDKLLNLRGEKYEKQSSTSLTLTPVIQLYNIFNVGDMIRWYVNKWLSINHMSKKYFLLEMDLLYDPNFLSVKLLGYEGKHKWHNDVYLPTIEFLDNVINNIHTYDIDSRDYWYILIDLRKRFVNIAQYMRVLQFNESGQLKFDVNIEDKSDDILVDKLKKYTHQLDKYRKQSVYNLIPNFDEILT